ncbi:hypothetical protein [Providencia alcalifaciens]|uniref:hypothetical protein n=1 Tax=Providencia alcalifaciens TaxID=126385 RepID=UPI002AA0B009|nr:hypothetical protein [Providencia alcalifaciens]
MGRIDKYRLEELRRLQDEKGELARWVIQLQADLDTSRREKASVEAKLYRATAPSVLAIPVGMTLVPKNPTDEQLRAILAVQWPATYRECLRHPDNGPNAAMKTEKEIDVATRQYSAAISAAPEVAGAVPEGGRK